MHDYKFSLFHKLSDGSPIPQPYIWDFEGPWNWQSFFSTFDCYFFKGSEISFLLHPVMLMVIKKTLCVHTWTKHDELNQVWLNQNLLQNACKTVERFACEWNICMNLGSKPVFYSLGKFEHVERQANISKWHDLDEQNFKRCWTKRIEMCLDVLWITNEIISYIHF